MRFVRYILAWLRYVHKGLVFGRMCQLYPRAPWLGLAQRELEKSRPKLEGRYPEWE